MASLHAHSESASGGLLWYEGASDYVGLNPALNAAELLVKMAPVATDGKKEKYLAFADSQLQYALGKNPMNGMFQIISWRSTFEHRKQCLSSSESIRTPPPILIQPWLVAVMILESLTLHRRRRHISFTVLLSVGLTSQTNILTSDRIGFRLRCVVYLLV